MTLDVAMQVLFHKRYSDRQLDELSRAFAVIMAAAPLETILPQPVRWLLGSRITARGRELRRAHQTLDRYAADLVAERARRVGEAGQQDALDALVALHGRSGRQQTLDDVRTLMLAGHDGPGRSASPPRLARETARRGRWRG